MFRRLLANGRRCERTGGGSRKDHPEFHEHAPPWAPPRRHSPPRDRPATSPPGRTRWRKRPARLTESKQGVQLGRNTDAALALLRPGLEQVEQHPPATVHPFDQLDRTHAHPFQLAMLEIDD